MAIYFNFKIGTNSWTCSPQGPCDVTYITLADTPSNSRVRWV